MTAVYFIWENKHRRNQNELASPHMDVILFQISLQNPNTPVVSSKEADALYTGKYILQQIESFVEISKLKKNKETKQTQSIIETEQATVKILGP